MLCFALHVSVINISITSVDIINNLALSWLGSYMFYLLVVYLPEKRNKYYQNIYSFWYIAQVLNKWEKIKNMFVGKQNISKDDEDAFNNVIKSIDRMSFQYFYLNKIVEDISLVLAKNNLYDALLIHYIDIINKNIDLLKTNVELRIDHIVQEPCNIETMIFLDKYFRAIKKNWNKELNNSLGQYEEPEI
jgi:hypothetical protein